MNIKQKSPLILASASPQRAKLLRDMGIAFEVVASQCPENSAERSPEKYAAAIALQKCIAVSKDFAEKSHHVLAADTIVYFEGNMIGKPSDRAAARHMIEQLSGRQHHVYTGYCIMKQGSLLEDKVVKTAVQFATISEDYLQWYLHQDDYEGKAGAYGIQSLGAGFIDSIQGSFSNVVGLPMVELRDSLIRCGVIEA